MQTNIKLYFRGTPRPEVFPISGNDTENTGQRARAAGINNPSRGYEIRKDGLASSLRATEMGSKNFIADIRQLNNPISEVTSGVSDAQRIYTTDQAKILKGLGGGLGAKMGLYVVPVLTPDRPEKRQNGRRFKTNGEPSFTLTGQDLHGVYVRYLNRNQKNIDGDYAFTVDASQTSGIKISKTVRAGGIKSPHGSKQNWDSYEVDGIIRRLTPKECERLQGFPDNWTAGFSDTQRYKMMGNAVTTNVITAIVKRL